MATTQEVQKDLLLQILHYCDHLREDVDMVVNSLRDDESTKNEQNEILLTMLQNIRTIQYSCEECLMHLDTSAEEPTPEVDKEAN